MTNDEIVQISIDILAGYGLHHVFDQIVKQYRRSRERRVLRDFKRIGDAVLKDLEERKASPDGMSPWDKRVEEMIKKRNSNGDPTLQYHRLPLPRRSGSDQVPQGQ